MLPVAQSRLASGWPDRGPVTDDFQHGWLRRLARPEDLRHRVIAGMRCVAKITALISHHHLTGDYQAGRERCSAVGH